MISFPKYQASESHKKRQQFQKEIRSNKRLEYFKKERRQFFVLNQQQQHLCSISSIQHLQKILRKYHTIGLKLDFLEINSFILSIMDQYLQEDLQKQLIEIFFSKDQYLSNVVAIVSICNLMNRQRFNQSLITKELFYLVINKLIPANRNKQTIQTNMGEEFVFIQNCQMICFVLQILHKKIENEINFQQVSQFYKDIQNSCNVFSPQYMSMISAYSRNSNLLPSQRVIQQYLTISAQQTRDQIELFYIIDVLQNYIRFTQKEDIQIILDYVKFISNQINMGSSPPKLKQQMINLFTSLINSCSETAFNSVFKNQNTQKIFNCILNRAKFGQMVSQILSTLLSICSFVERLNKQQLTQIIEYYPSMPQVLINWLQLQDQATVLHILLALYSILEKNSKSSQLMFNALITQKLKYLTMRPQNRLYQIALYIYQNFFSEYEKL